MKQAALKIILLFLSIIIIQACSTRIPAEDTTAPRIHLKIMGPGVDRDFESMEDFNEGLELEPSVTYRFILSFNDGGGLARAQWQIPDQRLMELITEITPPWTIADISPLSRILEWAGDEENPVNSSVLAGRFKINEGGISFTWGFFGRDYGGSSRTSNSTTRNLLVNLN